MADVTWFWHDSLAELQTFLYHKLVSMIIYFLKLPVMELHATRQQIIEFVQQKLKTIELNLSPKR